MIEIKTGNLELEEGTIVIDFFATWCGPCKMLSPILAKLSEEEDYKGFKFWKVDVDENESLVKDFNIYAMPTLVIVKGGKEIARQVGLIPEDQLRDFLNQGK